MRDDSPWKLFRWWHLVVLFLLLVPAAGSFYLGDTRPVVFSLWWIGFLTIGFGVVFGVLGSFVGFSALVWRKVRGEKPKAGEDA